MAKADNKAEDSAATEQEQPKDLRTFIDEITDDDGNTEKVTYQVADFNDEQKAVFDKLEIVVTKSQALEKNYEFQKEQFQVLAQFYVSKLKTLLSSGEDDEPDGVGDGEAEKQS